METQRDEAKPITCKITDAAKPEVQKPLKQKGSNEKNVIKKKKKLGEPMTEEEVLQRYPVLNDKALVEQFMKVPMTNNQKGRIRQAFRDQLQGTTENIIPEIINLKMTCILKNTPVLTDSDLRKLRILYNMLQTATKTLKQRKEPESKIRVKEDGDKADIKKNDEKKKGDRRYVVFIGNLPADISQEKIRDHFGEIGDKIKDLRMRTPPLDGSRPRIAYLELKDETSYELALSKHHTMLCNKRINVLYTAQKNGKITQAEAKAKSAKMVALQQAGKLVGSSPLMRKRSQRRKKMKMAQSVAGV